ncbi:hypothetical protein DAHU10_042120 [Hanseniaspora uvarum]|nr:hypothetical protein DAHU10_042120 [Hanseniaspora uvarum]
MLKIFSNVLLLYVISKFTFATGNATKLSTNIITSDVSSTTTYSTSYLNITGSDGLITDDTIIMVAVPNRATATTTIISELTTIARANSTTTFATSFTSFLGDDDVETIIQNIQQQQVLMDLKLLKPCTTLSLLMLLQLKHQLLLLKFQK